MGKETLEALIGVLDNWAAFFTLLVVLGVGGELVVHIMQSRANKKLIALQHTEAIAQETEAERLRKESASFQLDIAKAKKGAADATERAALAEQHTAELQASLRPRRLTAEQKAKLTALLNPFSALPITLEWVGSGTQEVADLASDILDAIISAGITVPNKNILMGEYFRGVQLKVGKNRNAEAEAVGRFLIETGLSTLPVTARPDPNADAFAIVIGSKP